MLLKELKHAIGKSTMKDRMDIFRFLTCSTKSDSQGAGSELKRNLLVLSLSGWCYRHRFGLAILFFSHWKASIEP